MIENLILCGAFDSIQPARRQLLWELDEALRARRPARPKEDAQLPLSDASCELAGAMNHEDTKAQRGMEDFVSSCLRGSSRPDNPESEIGNPQFPEPTLFERTRWEVATLGFAVETHPVTLFRERLATFEPTPAAQLEACRNGERVRAAGVVLCRMRPPTKSGAVVVFITLEDETGVVDAVIFPKVYEEYGKAAFASDLLVIEGRVQKQGKRDLSLIAEAVFNPLEGVLEDRLDGKTGLARRTLPLPAPPPEAGDEEEEDGEEWDEELDYLRCPDGSGHEKGPAHPAPALGQGGDANAGLTVNNNLHRALLGLLGAAEVRDGQRHDVGDVLVVDDARRFAVDVGDIRPRRLFLDAVAGVEVPGILERRDARRGDGVELNRIVHRDDDFLVERLDADRFVVGGGPDLADDEFRVGIGKDADLLRGGRTSALSNPLKEMNGIATDDQFSSFAGRITIGWLGDSTVPSAKISLTRMNRAPEGGGGAPPAPPRPDFRPPVLPPGPPARRPASAAEGRIDRAARSDSSALPGTGRAGCAGEELEGELHKPESAVGVGKLRGEVNRLGEDEATAREKALRENLDRCFVAGVTGGARLLRHAAAPAHQLDGVFVGRLSLVDRLPRRDGSGRAARRNPENARSADHRDGEDPSTPKLSHVLRFLPLTGTGTAPSYYTWRLRAVVPARGSRKSRGRTRDRPRSPPPSAPRDRSLPRTAPASASETVPTRPPSPRRERRPSVPSSRRPSGSRCLPAAPCSSAVCTWVCVPITAVARPSTYQPNACFSDVASAWKSTMRSGVSALERAWMESKARKGHSSGAMCVRPRRLATAIRCWPTA